MSLPDGSNELDPLSAASIYYGPDRDPRKDPKTRTFSSILLEPSRPDLLSDSQPVTRRASLDPSSQHPRRFLIRNVAKKRQELLDQEDLDKNQQITIDDKGPKVVTLGTLASNGLRQVDIRGNYILSNLLQEFTLALAAGRESIVIDLDRLNENPVSRLSRVISTAFWDNLTRRIDASNIEQVALDPKDWTDDPQPRIYVPRGTPEQYEYYSKLAAERPEIRLDVQWLPADKITGEYVRDLNAAPGLLAVAMVECIDAETGEKSLQGLPFVVPGGRFNELYGWDSYMIAIGLLVNGRTELAKAMVTHFCFCIQHYGKIFNANRSCFLGRSQPPFLTDMALRVYEQIKSEPGAKEFLRTAVQAAIKEYHGVWTSSPRFDPLSGLSRYRPAGVGVPPETEASHFVHVLEPYAKKHNMSHADFVQAYNSQAIHEPELDEYFLHDRAVRESGHDTSYRLENVAANLATVDLNSTLFKYEQDVSYILAEIFDNQLVMPAEFCADGKEPGYVETSAMWDRFAKQRRSRMDRFLWNEAKGMYFDYDTVKREQTTYESATTFWAMWAGVASPPKGAQMVERALPRFEVLGGLVSGTEESRGAVGLNRPNRQWDYPYGWAPQQMLAWIGLHKYNYRDEAARLAYRWLYMCTKAFFDYNGVVVEKYNVIDPIGPHKVDAEYGNQGSDFKGVAKEGFGWVNASYVFGLTFVTQHMKRALGTLTSWDAFHRANKRISERESENESAVE